MYLHAALNFEYIYTSVCARGGAIITAISIMKCRALKCMDLLINLKFKYLKLSPCSHNASPLMCNLDKSVQEQCNLHFKRMRYNSASL